MMAQDFFNHPPVTLLVMDLRGRAARSEI